MDTIDRIHIGALTHEDAILDGFDTLNELLARLTTMRAPDILWRIRWINFIPAPAISPLDVSPLKRPRTRRQRTDVRQRRADHANATSMR